MLTHLRIKNFKAWEDSGDIRLAPLTVIFGTNSAGKSSIGHLLLALKQTVQSVDRRKALNLGDAHSLIDLGTYEDCVYQHDTSKNIGFELAWKYKQPENHIKEIPHYDADEICLTTDLSFNSESNLIQAQCTSFNLYKKKKLLLNIHYEKNKGIYSNTHQMFNFDEDLNQFTDLWKFYQITTLLDSTKDGYLTIHFAVETERVFNNIHYLGPLREIPKRLYLWGGDAPEAVGQRGENAIAAILTGDVSRKFHYGDVSKSNSSKAILRSFGAVIAQSLYKLGLTHGFSLKPIAKGRKEYEAFIQVNKSSPKVRITDVGFGISQALPVIVQAFYAGDNSTIIMEQPEIHLHPKIQSDLADVFIDALHSKKIVNDSPHRQDDLNNFKKRENLQFIIESHSEHFLTRLQRRIAEEKIKPEEVAIYFVDNKDGKATIEELRINEYGDIENWPENFFGDEMGDLVARTQAAIKRRQQGQTT